MARKKKIGTITFHSSYNHGSMLQAYALQEYIKKNFGKDYDYQIINLRTKRQKDLYNKPFGFYDFKSILKKIFYIRYNRFFLERKDKYEEFLKNKLQVTQEYSDIDELKRANLDYDVCVSGSDQIWNYKILDFDWSFFLEFCGNKTRRISYAASFGPKLLDCDADTRRRIKQDIKKYAYISVREEGSAKSLKNIDASQDNISVNVDPTLLLEESDWEKIIGERIYKKDYIFLYDLKGKQEAYDVAKYLSKKYKLPIIIVKEKAKVNLLYKNIIKRYNAGPLEFLNYVKYANIVVSSSFHGNVFSIIFKKPFFAIGGSNDSRIRDLLAMFGLESRAISDVDDVKTKDTIQVNFDGNERAFERERQKAKDYFERALDI